MYKPFFFYLFENPRLFFAKLVIVVLSICIHETLHARVAQKLGDDTAVQNGYGKINPIRQMGRNSLIMLLVFGIAWGSVPVNVQNLRGRFAPAIVALSGIAGNIVLSILFILAATVVVKFGSEADSIMLNALFFGGVINLVLAMINLLPIPGFDGYAALVNIFPAIHRKQYNISNLMFILIICLFFLFFEKIYLLADIASIKMVSIFSQVIEWLA